MIILPKNQNDTADNVAAALLELITLDASVLFVVLGETTDALNLLQLADAQSNTGSTIGFVRKVVWIKTLVDAVDKPILDPFLRAGDPMVDMGVLAFTIGFGDRSASVFRPGDMVSAFRVFLAYSAAEAQPVH